MKRFKYNGYIITQDERSHHVMLTSPEGAVAHFSCDRPKTDAELRELADGFPAMLQLMRERRGAHA